jgi:hypothetical protein
VTVNELANASWCKDANESTKMKTIVMAAGLLALVAVATSSSANAKGCIKGAVVGGVAGHYAGHHGLLGAAAGCAIGRHEAKKHAAEKAHAHKDKKH